MGCFLESFSFSLLFFFFVSLALLSLLAYSPLSLFRFGSFLFSFFFLFFIFFIPLFYLSFSFRISSEVTRKRGSLKFGLTAGANKKEEKGKCCARG